jgi:hypothetical protein
MEVSGWVVDSEERTRAFTAHLLLVKHVIPWIGPSAVVFILFASRLYDTHWVRWFTGMLRRPLDF